MTKMCDYCGQAASLVNGDIIYPHRPDLHKFWYFHCAPCKAYVGCHPGTMISMGRLANKELRIAKQAAHVAFDVIWKQGHASRKAAYNWLAQQLNVDAKDCHIGQFDLDLCEQVVEVCQKHYLKRQSYQT